MTREVRQFDDFYRQYQTDPYLGAQQPWNRDNFIARNDYRYPELVSFLSQKGYSAPEIDQMLRNRNDFEFCFAELLRRSPKPSAVPPPAVSSITPYGNLLLLLEN